MRSILSKLITLTDRLLKWITTGLIILYRVLLSPVFGNNCRFQPTCSAYALEALRRFPFHKALWLSLKRISKCHPFSEGGFDPIPKHHG